MGNTYRKEKAFDERASNKTKKHFTAEQQRKTNKNRRIIDVLYEDDDEIDYEDDYEDDYEPDEVQHDKQK